MKSYPDEVMAFAKADHRKMTKAQFASVIKLAYELGSSKTQYTPASRKRVAASWLDRVLGRAA